jgi:hypothetical protein
MILSPSLYLSRLEIADATRVKIEVTAIAISKVSFGDSCSGHCEVSEFAGNEMA